VTAVLGAGVDRRAEIAAVLAFRFDGRIEISSKSREPSSNDRFLSPFALRTASRPCDEVEARPEPEVREEEDDFEAEGGAGSLKWSRVIFDVEAID